VRENLPPREPSGDVTVRSRATLGQDAGLPESPSKPYSEKGLPKAILAETFGGS
jgi:hypothetical protein